LSEKGALPSSYDPLAPTRTVRKNGELISEPIVVLGPDDRFPTLGNTGPYGDCAVVADSNIVRVDHIEKRIRSVPAMTTNEALAEWAAIDGGTGAGLTDAQLLHAWAGSAGLLGTRLRGWRQLGTGHLTALKRAMEASGALYVGILLPSAGTTGDTIDPTMTATTEVSGHALALYGWTPRGFLAVTWGESVLIPYSWWTSYSTTAYALKILQKTPPARKPAAG
jgi:hypothetical protein